MAHPLDGIRAKLKRAEENIKNLEREITLFFDYGPNRAVPDNDMQAIQKLADLHVDRPVPIRFSVLAGEIVHQLRSALDHLAWQLSSDSYRKKRPKVIAFPIFKTDPAKEKKMKSYARKVEGMSRTAKALVERLQPYKSSASGGHLLQIIEEMDVVEKHRELIFMTRAFRHIRYPGWRFQRNRGSTIESDAKFPYFGVQPFDPAMDVRGQISVQVAFAEFGVLKYQPIIPSLKQLLDGIRRVIALFDREFS